MSAIQREMIERVKTLMMEEGVTLTDDLNQCEAAVYEFVQRLGATLLQEHFSKNTRLRGVKPGLHLWSQSEVRE